MVPEKSKRLSREDWIRGALDLLVKVGVEGVKIVPLAEQLGVQPDLLAAAKAARDKGLKVIGLTGKQESALGALCDIEICTPGGRFADRVQELHIKVIHIFMELVERALFQEKYD